LPIGCNRSPDWSDRSRPALGCAAHPLTAPRLSPTSAPTSGGEPWSGAARPGMTRISRALRGQVLRATKTVRAKFWPKLHRSRQAAVRRGLVSAYTALSIATRHAGEGRSVCARSPIAACRRRDPGLAAASSASRRRLRSLRLLCCWSRATCGRASRAARRARAFFVDPSPLIPAQAGIQLLLCAPRIR